MALAPSPLELRILDGLHAGATAALPADGGLSVGALQDDTDIVLRDLPVGEGGHLAMHDEGWHWHPRDGGEALLIRSGQLFACGATCLTIQPEDAPWPDAETLARARPAPPAAATPPEKQAEDATPENAMPAPPEAGGKSPPPEARRRSPFLTVALFVGLGVVAFAATAAVLTHWATPAPPPPPAPVASADVRGLLASLGLDARLTVVDTASGNVEIHGFVADDDTRSRLDNAVSRLPRRSPMRVLTMDEAVERADDIVRTRTPGLTVAAANTGNFRLVGVAPDRDAVEQLIDRLMLALPRGAEFTDTSLHRGEVESALATLLRERALPAPEVDWDAGRLELSGPVGEDEIDRWEDLMQALGDLFGERLQFVARFDLPSPASFLRRNVRAVVGGETPFVVTASGNKILVGGLLGRYRLLDVRDTLSIWEWPGGRDAFALER